MAGRKEVVIKLTEDQRRQIKSVTGQDITELKVGTVDDLANPLATGRLDDRANPLAAAMVDERANPLSLASEVESRANPTLSDLK